MPMFLSILLFQAILGIRYLAQNTFTNKALLLARLQAFTAASGARNSATKIAIVLTDGQSSLPTETTREANLLKDAGVLVLSIGIGDVVKESELEAIASLPQDVFRVNSFDVLNTIQKAVTNKTCDKGIEFLKRLFMSSIYLPCQYLCHDCITLIYSSVCHIKFCAR